MGLRNIGATITLDGDKEFKNQMSAVNRELRSLKAELAATSSQFQNSANSTQALSSKLTAQQALYDQQRVKVQSLARAVQESTAKNGENSAVTDELRASYARAKAELYNMETEIGKTAAELKKASAATAETSDAMDDLADSAQESSGGLNAWGVAAGNLLAQLAQRGTQIIKEIAETGIQYNAQLEKYTTSMTTALGSAELAGAALNQIKADAAVTPYSLDTLTKANMFLIATGKSADEARATIMALSDAVSATGGGNDELIRMSQNLQQISNAGKATSTDIRQFAMAGIDVYGILAEYTGKTTAEIKNTAVTYDMLAGALQRAAAEGGRYFGANAAQAKTLNGQVSTLKDNVKSKLGEALSGVSNIISGKLLPAANEFVTGMDVEKICGDFENMVTLAASVGGAVAGIRVIGKIDQLATDISNCATGFAVYKDVAGAAAVQQAALNGTFTAGQTIIGVMSGQISLATAKQLGWNAAARLFPGLLLAGAILTIVEAAKSCKQAISDLKNENLGDIMESDDLEAAKTKIAELQAQYQAMKDAMNRGDDYNLGKMQGLCAAIDELTPRIAELEQAQTDEAAYMASTEGKAESLAQSITELCTAYKEAYDAAYESLSGQFDLFEKVDEVSTITAQDMIAGMNSQADYWDQYSTNLDTVKSLTADSIGLNKDLIAGLSDGSAQSVQNTASIAKGYEDALKQGPEKAAEYITNMNTAFEHQQEAMKGAAEGIAESQTDFTNAMNGLVETAATGAEDMNQAEAMKTSALNSIQGFINGIDAKEGDVIKRMQELAASASSAFNVKLEVNSPSKVFYRSGLSVTEGFTKGVNSGRSEVNDTMISAAQSAINGFEREISSAPQPAPQRVGTVVNIYPQTLDEGTIDYIYHRFDTRMGASL